MIIHGIIIMSSTWFLDIRISTCSVETHRHLPFDILYIVCKHIFRLSYVLIYGSHCFFVCFYVNFVFVVIICSFIVL